MERFLPGRLRHDRRLRLLVLPACAIAAVSILVALSLHAWLRGAGSPAERAARLAATGAFTEADRLYRQALSTRVELATLIEFIDNRAALVGMDAVAIAAGSEDLRRLAEGDRDLPRYLASADLRPAEAELARFWLAARLGAGAGERGAIVSLADRAPPERLANHLLARDAMLRGELDDAARRFEREGLAFPRDAQDDLVRALRIWQELEAWDELRVRASDPRYRAAGGLRLRLKIAEHDRDWPSVLRWIWPASVEGVTGWPIALAALSGVLWFAIAARLGRVTQRVPGRVALYAAAFVLGVLSVYPTLLVILLEEKVFHLRQMGELIPDAIYFVFGVGLREEACKLLLFLPLLPLLKRRASRLEALTCGALVGLGFAAEENLLYFQDSDPSIAMTRFLTANFLHMSLTALAGLAVYDASRAWNRSAEILNAMLPMVVLIHGAYNLLLSSPQLADISFLGMALFVLVSQRFLRELLSLSSASEQEGALRLFIAALALLMGASYVYATVLVGPLAGLAIVATGFIGVVIFAYMFVRELA